MNLLQDILTYIRRLVKTPSNALITDNLLIDYVNRFWLMDMDARVQLFDFKTKYQFQTRPGISHYNMPLYNVNNFPVPATSNTLSTTYYPQTEPGNQIISYYPVYQGFMEPAFVNGIQVPFYTLRSSFYNIWPLYVQALNDSFFGDGVNSSYTLTLPNFPAMAGYVDITGIIAAASYSGSNTFSDPIVATTLNLGVPKTSVYPAVYVTTQDENNNTLVVSDSGQFLDATGVPGNMQLGMLTGDVTGPYSTTQNVVNYTNGQVNVTFPSVIQDGVPINLQCLFFQQGIPRAVLFENNCISIMPPPDTSYWVEIDAYLTPAAFLSTSQAIPFAYMCEYIARGAARKLLADTGDIEQFAFYEPLFKEQETLVWKRSQRVVTSTRTGTIFSEYSSQSPSNNYAGGGN